jgi:hypothetical protein
MMLFIPPKGNLVMVWRQLVDVKKAIIVARVPLRDDSHIPAVYHLPLQTHKIIVPSCTSSSDGEF